MVNRERFMLDIDSEGFPLVDTAMASYTIGQRTLNHEIPQAILADHKCIACITPSVNPQGWREVDGVQLPSVESWAELDAFFGWNT